MDEKMREQVALFRYGLIVPLINGQILDQKEYLAEVSNRVHDTPYYGAREFTAKTITNWLRLYKRGGFDALKPKVRNDKGDTRAIRGELKEKILQARTEQMDMPVKLFYEHLVKKGIFLPNQVSYSTLNRYLHRNNLASERISKNPERKRFAYDTVNILWQGDISHGPYLKTPKKKIPTYLFAFIDDCSRLIPFAMFSVEQNIEPLKETFKQALLRRGIPRLVYVDNGKVFRSDIFNIICASLGITLTYTPPYDAASKGKIERFFGTVRKRFYPLFKDQPFSSVEELNQAFWRWLEEDYHRKIHSALEMTPLDKFLSQTSKIRPVNDPQKLEEIFFHRINRKVTSDGTISINKKLYEISPQFIGQKVELRYDPRDLKNVYVFSHGQNIARAKPVNFSDNARMKRTSPISFSSLEEREKENSNRKIQSDQLKSGGEENV